MNVNEPTTIPCSHCGGSGQVWNAPAVTGAAGGEAVWWVVWSNEHMAWWRPNERGYSTDLRGAGLYIEADAKRCEGMRSPMHDGRVPEIAMPLSEAIRFDSEHGRPLAAPQIGSAGSLFAELLDDRERRAAVDARGAGTERWEGPLTRDQVFARARACGMPGFVAAENAARFPAPTTPFPWRAEIAGPDDAKIVCGEYGVPSTFANIAECHTADDARWIVALANDFMARRDERGIERSEGLTSSGSHHTTEEK